MAPSRFTYSVLFTRFSLPRSIPQKRDRLGCLNSNLRRMESRGFHWAEVYGKWRRTAEHSTEAVSRLGTVSLHFIFKTTLLLHPRARLLHLLIWICVLLFIFPSWRKLSSHTFLASSHHLIFGYILRSMFLLCWQFELAFSLNCFHLRNLFPGLVLKHSLNYCVFLPCFTRETH
jgi:hypothetical protein